MQQNMYKIYEENYNNLDKQSQTKKKKKKRYSTFTDSNTQYCQDIRSSLWIYKFNRLQIKILASYLWLSTGWL